LNSLRNTFLKILTANNKKELRMAGEKISVSFEINPESQEMLQKIVEKYNLPDTSKAIRCLLEYVADDGDWDNIFDEIRCNHC